MQGLVCPKGPSLKGQGRTISFYQEKDLFPRASANIPRYRDKNIDACAETRLGERSGAPDSALVGRPLPWVCATIAGLEGSALRGQTELLPPLSETELYSFSCLRLASIFTI